MHNVASILEYVWQHAPMLGLYLHIIVSAIFPIYTSAHASLARPSSAAKKEKLDTYDDEDEEEETLQAIEGMSASDAIVFPVTAAAFLALLYWLIQRYGADLINLIMAWYFAGAGIFSVATLVSDGAELVTEFVFPKHYSDQGRLWTIQGKQHKVIAVGATRSSPLPGFLGRWSDQSLVRSAWRVRDALKQKYTLKAYVTGLVDVESKFTLINGIAAFIGLGAVAYNNLVAHPWWLTNLQGFAVSYFAMQFISPTSFIIGSLVLGGLFFYDIWAVFFTPLMVTVATKLEQPIKLVFPRPDTPEGQARAYSMLGLGDIVLPGLMIGLALRFDLYMFYLRKQKIVNGQEAEKAAYTSAKGHWGSLFWIARVKLDSLPQRLRNARFPKPYFTAALIGYTLGMVLTLGVMTVFQHAQPALLYLVPTVLIFTWGTALIRGELKDMWQYSEEINGEDATHTGSKEDDNADSQNPVVDHKHDQSWTAALMQFIGLPHTSNKVPSTSKESAKRDTHSKTNVRNTDKAESKADEKKVERDTNSLVEISIKRYTSSPSVPDHAPSGDFQSDGRNEPATALPSLDGANSSSVEQLDAQAERPVRRLRSVKGRVVGRSD